MLWSVYLNEAWFAALLGFRDAAPNVLKNLLIISMLILSSVVGQAQESRPRVAKTENPKKVTKTVSTRLTALRTPTTFVATAYSLRGRTASGELVRKGIIAADPRILPLGTKVHIEGMGEFVVKDTGGAIKGMRIDIWIPSTKDALKFGRRQVKLKVID